MEYKRKLKLKKGTRHIIDNLFLKLKQSRRGKGRTSNHVFYMRTRWAIILSGFPSSLLGQMEGSSIKVLREVGGTSFHGNYCKESCL